jgi:hypothetical protein
MMEDQIEGSKIRVDTEAVALILLCSSAKKWGCDGVPQAVLLCNETTEI